MSFSPAPRTDNAASIVGGILGGLVVAGSMIAFFSLRDARDARDARVPDDSVAELRVAVAELRAQTAELRAQLAANQPQPFPPPPPFMPPPPIAEFTPPPPPPLPPGLEQAIDCPGEHSCTISRAYIDELLANPSSLARQARIMPSVKDGETRGFKVYGIRPGSLPKLLGYKNGDLILSINGIPLKGVDGAMAAYARLRSADTFSVEIERRGERVLKTCDLR